MVLSEKTDDRKNMKFKIKPNRRFVIHLYSQDGVLVNDSYMKMEKPVYFKNIYKGKFLKEKSDDRVFFHFYDQQFMGHKFRRFISVDKEDVVEIS